MEQIARLIHRAERHCKIAGVRLTQKRKQILEVLIRAQTALSAYEIAQRFQQQFASSIAPMSVYRMLEVLTAQNLVHKLELTNKFLLCAHIACDHQHHTMQFLICANCTRVQEVELPAATLEALAQSAGKVGFDINNNHLELLGRCHDCS